MSIARARCVSIVDARGVSVADARCVSVADARGVSVADARGVSVDDVRGVHLLIRTSLSINSGILLRFMQRGKDKYVSLWLDTFVQ